MLREFHPCRFNFADQDIRVDAATVTGGTSISGYEDVIRVDGGGIWRADFTGGDFGDRDDAGRADTLAYRASTAAMLGGAVAVIVLLCDGLHQPISGEQRVPHSDKTQFADDALYQGTVASATVSYIVNGQVGGLRCTMLDIAFAGPRSLIGGERFSYEGARGWGERAAEIYAIEDMGGGVQRITFQPPIRGGIAVGDTLDFDNIRCRMRRTSPASNALNMGTFSSAAISFLEDMRPPVQP